MKIKSALVTQVSGSIGGMTGSRNRYGMYLRARAVPVNPNTSRQTACRERMQDAVTAWFSQSWANRQAWELYAANTKMTGASGDAVLLTGQNHFIRSYMTAVQAGLDVATMTAPTVYLLAELTPPLIASFNSPNIDVGYDATDEWCVADNGALLVFCGRPQNPTVNFYKGPWRHVATVPGDTAAPPASPASFGPVADGGYVYDETLRYFGYCRAISADRRVSEPVYWQIDPSVP